MFNEPLRIFNECIQRAINSLNVCLKGDKLYAKGDKLYATRDISVFHTGP